MRAPYQEIGGLRWGVSPALSGYATFPLAQLLATEQELIVKTTLPFFRKRFEIPRSHVVSIRLKRGIVGGGCRISHNLSHLPQYIDFGSLTIDTLKVNLLKLGYPIEPNGNP